MVAVAPLRRQASLQSRPYVAACRVLKQPAPNSDMAETMALVNGIHLAVAGMLPPPASRIFAQTDCLTAIQAPSGQLINPKTIRQ